jgi:hypothetical protein
MKSSTAEERKPQMNKRVRVALQVLIASAAAAAVLAIYMVGTTGDSAAKCDFIGYWAAGRLLAHGQNPYGYQAARALEIAAGRDPGVPMLVMRTPVAFLWPCRLGGLDPRQV